MKTIIACLCIFLSLSVFASTTGHATSVLLFEGTAYDINTKDVLYKEQHTITLNERDQYKATAVTYLDSSGEVFAKKTLDFSHDLMSPLVDFEDTRVGISVKVSKEDNGLSVRYKSASDSASGIVKRVPMMVVDAGFDQMLLQYWDVLLNNERLEFEFLAPTRAQLISFSLTPTFQNDAIIGFSLAPSNFFLRLLVDPIKLTYDKLTKRILIYEGLTNIEKTKQGKATGDYYIARIEYHY